MPWEVACAQGKQARRLWLQGEQVRGVYDGSGAAGSGVAAVRWQEVGSHPTPAQASLLGFAGAKK